MEDQGRWKEVCEQAAKEQDPKKLMELTKEICIPWHCSLSS
jgi:hypothetical protein